VHFVVLGAMIFGLAEWHARHTRTDTVITIGPEELAGLRADWQRRTGTAPTPADDAAVVARFVDDEILYREALALGLDRGDVIVRRRLLQKMEFLLDARAEREPPTEADLQALLEAEPDRYRRPARVDFDHVFLDRIRHAADHAERAAEIRAALEAGSDPAREGDPFLRGRTFRAQSRLEIASLFGREFADAVVDLPVGRWSGPIPSTYGWHVVRVTRSDPASLPAVDEIEAKLRLDWIERRRADVRREALAELRTRYELRIVPGSIPSTPQ